VDVCKYVCVYVPPHMSAVDYTVISGCVPQRKTLTNELLLLLLLLVATAAERLASPIIMMIL